MSERRLGPSRPRPLGRRADDRVVLTEHQQRVLDLGSLGYENKEIAAELGTSTQAVKQTVSVLLRKYDATTRGALMRTALAMRLLGSTEPRDIPFQYLFDEAPMFMGLTRGPDHRFTIVNRAARRAFGERDYVGRAFAELFPEASPAFVAALHRAFETGEPSTATELRVRLETPDGPSDAWITFTAHPIQGRDGNCEGLAFYGLDVTAQVRARAGIGPELRRVLEHLPVAAGIVDAQGRPLFMNAHFLRLVGRAPDPSRPLQYQASDFQVRWPHTGQLVTPGTGPSARALRGWPFDGQLLFRRDDGDVRMHVSARPLPDADGKVVGAILVMREVDAA